MSITIFDPKSCSVLFKEIRNEKKKPYHVAKMIRLGPVLRQILVSVYYRVYSIVHTAPLG